MKTPLIRLSLIAVALLLALTSSPALSAPGPGKGNKKSKGKAASSPGRAIKKPKIKPVPPGQAKKLSKVKREPEHKDIHLRMRFHDRDRATFQTHFGKYKKHPHGLPPGLAKNLQRGKPLPSGWQKKVREGWTVDDSLWSHFQPVPPANLPSSLEHPQNTGIYLVGDRLVRVHMPSREIIDLIRIASIVLSR